MSRSAPPLLEAAPDGLQHALDRAAELAALVAAARAVLAGFRGEIHAGTLRPPQHASLLLLEEAITLFTGLADGKPSAGGSGERPSGAGIGLSAPAAEQSTGASA